MTKTKNVSDLPLKKYAEKTESIIGLSANGLVAYNPKAVFVKRPPVSDLNNATRTGYYILNTNDIANIPEPGIVYGVLLVFEDDTTVDEAEFVQCLISLAPTCSMFIRKKGNQSSWGYWYKMNTTALST